jgi:hypothetical protein
VATRITRAMSDGRDDIVAQDLSRLDSGALAEDKLFALFTPGELRQALKRRIGALATERDAIERLMDRLDGGPSGLKGGVHRAQIGPDHQRLFGN